MVQLKKIGVQAFTIGQSLTTEEDVKRSFEKLKKMGYDQIQTAGCAIPYETYGKLAREAGLEIVGTHDNFDMMVENVEDMLDKTEALDTKIMGIGGLWAHDRPAFEDFIEKANKIAAAAAKRGMSFSYHNHSHEFVKLEDGSKAMELLAEKLDPDNVNFVLDTYWIQHGGADIRYWIEKLAGRIKIIHLKDMAKEKEGNGQFITEIGNGNIWWEGVIETALRTGVESFVVEQDCCPGDPFDSLKISSDYLHANFF